MLLIIDNKEVRPTFKNTPTEFDEPRFFYKKRYFGGEGWIEEFQPTADGGSMVLCQGEWSLFPVWIRAQALASGVVLGDRYTRMRFLEEEVKPLFTEAPTKFEEPEFFYKSTNFEETGIWIKEKELYSNRYSMVLCQGEWSFYPTWKETRAKETI